MLTFQKDECRTDNKKTPQINNSFRLVVERISSCTPPATKQELHPPKSWKSRIYEGGTIEDALPILEIGLMEGCTVSWNGRQFTAADIELHKGLLDLGDKMNEFMVSRKKTERRTLATSQ